MSSSSIAPTVTQHQKQQRCRFKQLYQQMLRWLVVSVLLSLALACCVIVIIVGHQPGPSKSSIANSQTMKNNTLFDFHPVAGMLIGISRSTVKEESLTVKEATYQHDRMREHHTISDDDLRIKSARNMKSTKKQSARGIQSQGNYEHSSSNTWERQHDGRYKRSHHHSYIFSNYRQSNFTSSARHNVGNQSFRGPSRQTNPISPTTRVSPTYGRYHPHSHHNGGSSSFGDSGDDDGAAGGGGGRGYNGQPPQQPGPPKYANCDDDVYGATGPSCAGYGPPSGTSSSATQPPFYPGPNPAPPTTSSSSPSSPLSSSAAPTITFAPPPGVPSKPITVKPNVPSLAPLHNSTVSSTTSPSAVSAITLTPTQSALSISRNPTKVPAPFVAPAPSTFNIPPFTNTSTNPHRITSKPRPPSNVRSNIPTLAPAANLPPSTTAPSVSGSGQQPVMTIIAVRTSVPTNTTAGTSQPSARRTLSDSPSSSPSSTQLDKKNSTATEMNRIQLDVNVLQSSVVPHNASKHVAVVMNNILNANTPFHAYPANFKFSRRRMQALSNASIFLVQDPNASDVSVLDDFNSTTSWRQYDVAYQCFDYPSKSPIQNETLLQQITSICLKAVDASITSGSFLHQLAAVANQSHVDILNVEIPGNEPTSNATSSQSPTSRTFQLPLSTKGMDLRRWIGIAIALATVGGSTLLMHLGAQRENKLKQEELWGFPLATEQDVGKFLNLGFMWQQGEGPEGPPKGVIVFNKEKVGYRDDDSILMGGFHNSRWLMNAAEVTLPSSGTSGEAL